MNVIIPNTTNPKRNDPNIMAPKIVNPLLPNAIPKPP